MNEKVLVVGVSSQYVHSMLVPYIIKSNSKCKNICVYECNVNMPFDRVMENIFSFQAQIVAFSTYVFNIDFVNKISVELKKHGVTVVYGGIEAESNIDKALDYCDYLLVGDSEIVFDEFYFGNRSSRVIYASSKVDLSKVNSPYTEKYFNNVDGKIAYFEGSRGCPFRCSYCMSADNNLRLNTIDNVIEQLALFKGKNIRVLKFVDRTFNANIVYANKIIKYLLDNQNDYGYQIHFEIAPELIDQSMVDLLKKFRPNFIRMEVGMQSLNVKTLTAINRPCNTKLILEKINMLTQLKNIDTHVDIIAGLPFEDKASLANTFDLLYTIKPTEIQLGLLKILPNSPLSKQNLAGFIYQNVPPYAVKETPQLTQNEVTEILKCEQVVNKVFNSHYFDTTLDYLLNSNGKYQSAFNLFYDFGKRIIEPHKLSLFNLIQLFLCFLVDSGYDKDKLIDFMRFDYLTVNNSRILPKCLYIKYNKKVCSNAQDGVYVALLNHDVLDKGKEKQLTLNIDYKNKDEFGKKYKYWIE